MKKRTNTMRQSAIIMMTVVIAVLLHSTIYAQKLDSDLRKAAKKGQIAKVHSYLRQGASINSTDKNGNTALMFAAEKGHVEVVKALLEREADMTATDKKGESALDKAKKKKKSTVIMVLEFTQAKLEHTVDAYQQFLSRYPNSEFTRTAHNAIEKLEFEKASEINTVDAYQTFLEKYPQSSHARQLNKQIMTLEYDNIKELNTLEAYAAFKAKYSRDISYSQRNEIEEKILELSYQKALETNTVESLNQFMADFPKSDKIEDIKDRLFHLQNKDIIDNILFSKNDKIRADNFRTFVQREFIDNNYDAANLSKLLRLLATKFKEDHQLLPVSSGRNSFFRYFADIEYFPTVQENTDHNKLWENAVAVLTPYQSIQKLYSNKHNYETAYLAHNIGRVACLIKAEKPQGQFFNVGFWDISSQSQRSVLDAFAEAFARSYETSGVEGAMSESQRGQNYSLKLIEIYKQSIVDLFSILESPKTTSQTKLYILKRLGHWVELIQNIKDEFIQKLQNVAKNDDNAQVRSLAARARTNAIAEK